MTQFYPKDVITKAERDGLDLVKHKIKQGVYQDWKLPILKKWISDKEREVAIAEKAEIMADPDTGELGLMDAEVVVNGETMEDPEPELSETTVTAGGETPVGATLDDPDGVLSQDDIDSLTEEQAQSEDADREMVGDDADLVDDIGNK